MAYIIAIIGNANIQNDTLAQEISYELGKLIIDNGYILATGGLGGVMEYASKGAKSSKRYNANSIIGVLPNYLPDDANKYLDIVIPTGMGIARNLILISMSNAVIAVSGGSGTLNEISAAWQMKKLIIGMQVGGWSEKLGGQRVDDRRDDIIYPAKNANEAIKILNTKIIEYQSRKFKGVAKYSIEKKKVEIIIRDYFKTKKNLKFIGKGNEGFVFTDNDHIYKLIDNTEESLKLYWTLLSLSETLEKENTIVSIPKFKVYFLEERKYILIKYKYQSTSSFIENRNIHIDKYINLLKEFQRIHWTLTDFKPQNIRLTEEGNLLVVDIGKSFLPMSNYLFDSMCRKAFVTYKLQEKLPTTEDFKKYFASVKAKLNFSLLIEQKKWKFTDANLKQDFNTFYNKIGIIDKKDILNPIIKDVFQSHIKVKNVFDYGSGHGDMSFLLKNLNLDVTAYEPDKDIIEKYKEKYYHNVNVLSDELQIKKLITNKIKFDSVLCSLVLCHPLAETKQNRLNHINIIMENIISLSKRYVIIVICNPLYTNQRSSALQKRCLPNDFNYKNEVKFKKNIYSSKKDRFDIHRPLSFYENLFNKYNLDIKEVIQTNDNRQHHKIKNSDFIIFILEKCAV